jgi:hypothetical protein
VAERDAVAIDDGGALDLVGRDQADILVGFQAELEIVILLGLAAEIGGSTGGGEARAWRRRSRACSSSRRAFSSLASNCGRAGAGDTVLTCV